MDLIKISAVIFLLAFPAARAWPQAVKKTEAPEIQAARRKLDELRREMKKMRGQAAQLKGALEQNDIKLQAATASAKTPFVKNIGRRALAKNRLAFTRAALQMYYADTGGKYPASLEKLIPLYLKEVPELDIPDHKKTRKAVMIKKMKGKDISGSVSDTGGWLYVTDAGSDLRGKLYIDARTEDKGKPLFEY